MATLSCCCCVYNPFSWKALIVFSSPFIPTVLLAGKHSDCGQGWNIKLFQNHIIIESFEFQGTRKGHLLQLPSNEQRNVQLSQVTQSLVQPDLECLQEWGIHYISRQSVPLPHYPHLKILFRYIQPKSTLFTFEIISPCLITTDPAEETVLILP